MDTAIIVGLILIHLIYNNNKLNKIMATLEEVQAEIIALTEQAQKSKAEIIAKIQALEDASGGIETTPEFDAAFAALKASVQGVDDIVADQPEPTEPIG